MKHKLLKIAAVSAATGIFLSLGWPFFELTVHCRTKRDVKKWFRLSQMKVNHPRYKFEKEYEAGKAWCQGQAMQDCHIRSADGLLLHASFFPAKDAERIVVLCHGYKGSSFGDFANIARFLHEHKCSLLFIDQRCCGESEGDFITFGAKEQYDIQEWAWYAAGKNKDRLPIYLYGESMGAAAVLMAAGHRLPEEVRGLIADCGFRSMRGQLQDLAAKWFHLHWIGLLLFRVDLFCRLLGGFRMKDADTTKALKTNKRPVLFFHGEKDTYVYMKNSVHNHALCRAPKELAIIPEARHLCSVYEQPELYRKKLLHFFNTYDKPSSNEASRYIYGTSRP